MNPKKLGKGKRSKKQFSFKIKINVWTVLFALVLIFFVLPLVLTGVQLSGGSNKVELSQLVDDIKEEKVDKVLIENSKLVVTYKDGSTKFSTKEENQSFSEVLKDSGVDPSKVNYNIVDQSLTKTFGDIAGIVLPLILMGAFFYFILKAQSKGANDIFSFGRSRAKVFAKGKQDVTFKDVAGVDEAKKELEELVDFLKNPAKYRKIGARTPKGALLFGPAGVGKCIVGDSLVWTSKGLLEIRDIPKYFSVEENGFVHGATLASFDPNFPAQTTASASHWYDLGISDTLKVETQLGHEIEGTYEHPVVSVNDQGKLEFRTIDKLKVGDWIPIKTGDQIFGNYKALDAKTSYLLGLLTGDGGMSIKDRIYFSTADKQLLLSFKNYFKERFDYDTKKVTNRKYDYFISSSNIKSEITRYGMDESYSRNKKIPDQVMLAPKENIVAFLQGLFDTDGSVYKSGKVEFTTTSKKLAKQVSALLINLGVMHKFFKKGENQFSNVYTLLISGTSLLNFSQQVGFRLQRKQEKLDLYISKTKLRTNVDLIPFQGERIKRVWRHLVECNKKPSRYVKKSFHKDIFRYLNGTRKPSKESLKIFLDACVKSDPEIYTSEDFRFLRLLTESGLFFDRVKDVSKSENRVYDFTVPKTHSFISNGFISHNTLLAKAVAGEAGVPFFSMAGSEFMEMLVGVGASRVRDLFQQAKASAPSIIFIDEIDAIGRQRGKGFMGGHDEREQTLNQILVEMDGFTPNDNVVVIAATNRGDLLDPALLRPGRFDRRVILDMPDKEGRLAILKIHARGKKFGRGINWERVSDRTVGFSGADLENMLNESAIIAARNNKGEISMLDIEEAATKVKLGPAKKRIQSEEDKKITAYHEAGHAIVTHFLKKTDPVHRISIVARGMSLGHTLIPPAADRTHETKSRLLDQISAMLGGRAAEEVVFKEMTSGASNDIAQATKIAKAMVTEWGMSDLGTINLGPDSGMGDFGQLEWYEQASNSQAFMEKVDSEVKKILDSGYKEAVKLIKEKRKLLDKVSEKLIEVETLDRDQFENIVGIKK